MTTSDYATIDHAQLARKLQTNEPDNFDPNWGYALVHVRRHDDSGRADQIPGSIELRPHELDSVEGLFAKGKEIIFYCDSPGCDASTRVAHTLALRGFHRIVDYEGGMADWTAAGEPVATRPS